MKNLVTTSAVIACLGLALFWLDILTFERYEQSDVIVPTSGPEAIDARGRDKTTQAPADVAIDHPYDVEKYLTQVHSNFNPGIDERAIRDFVSESADQLVELFNRTLSLNQEAAAQFSTLVENKLIHDIQIQTQITGMYVEANETKRLLMTEDTQLSEDERIEKESTLANLEALIEAKDRARRDYESKLREVLSPTEIETYKAAESARIQEARRVFMADVVERVLEIPDIDDYQREQLAGTVTKYESIRATNLSLGSSVSLGGNFGIIATEPENVEFISNFQQDIMLLLTQQQIERLYSPIGY